MTTLGNTGQGVVALRPLTCTTALFGFVWRSALTYTIFANQSLQLSEVVLVSAGPGYIANTGAGYRHVADLGSFPPGLWLVDGQSQSGQLHTRHYNDSIDMWEDGELCFVPLGADFKGTTTTVLRSRATALPTAGAARVERKEARL